MAKGVPVKIFQNNWTVIVTNSPKDLVINNKQCKGSILYKDSVIFLDENTSDKDRQRIIRHELAHAMLYETQISLRDCYTEEDLCEFIAIYGNLIEEMATDILSKIKSS
jgi:Zn-dependent peptidase ImmA (M78 family)